MTLAIWCILIVGLMPYFVYGPAAAKVDNRLPRVSAGGLTDLPARAYGAHLNSFETFPLFAIAVLVAHVAGGPGGPANWLAPLYIIIRLVYFYCYLSNLQPHRTIVFFIGLLDVLLIFISPLFR